MFDNLQERLKETFRKLSGQARISEKNIEEALSEVRRALLEADVNFRVVRGFIRRVQEKALGVEVIRGIQAGQQFIKIVHDELVDLLGGKTGTLELPQGERTVIMLCGLQGAGKTTIGGKLSVFLRKQGRHPLLVAADVYRPAAVTQLEVVGRKANTPVFSLGTDVDPVDICLRGVRHAEEMGFDTVILDTAGRLHVDEQMMQELVRVKKSVKPRHILFVVDAMVGQDAVNQARQFHDTLEFSGVILTKLDGDARGGAALSVREVTGKPILFAGVGEKLEDFDRFHPDRMAGRILGMGDIVSLVEQAQETIDQEAALKMQKKLIEQTFTLDDFLHQMQQMKKMGGLRSVMDKLPKGMLGGMPADMDVEEGEMVRMEAIINSMTLEERTYPHIIGGSRRNRIAKGSGTTTGEINRVLKQFDETKRMVKKAMSGGGIFGRMVRGAGQAAGPASIQQDEKAKAKAKAKNKEKKKRQKQARKQTRKK